MTVFGHAVLLGFGTREEATASEKTPMQWHRSAAYEPMMSFSLASAMELTLPSYCLVNSWICSFN